jgi:thymidylate kinase
MKEQIELPGSVEKCGREETRPDAGMTVSVQSRVARLLIKKLAEECESYCILTGYEELPDRFDSDIDFMVSNRDFARIPAMIDEIAEATGTALFQAISHEVSARAFRLAARNEDELAFIQPDSCSDYRHFGKLWLRADEMLAERRLHSRGFWIPSASHEFIYYLIKRVNKRDFGSAHGARLSYLYSEEPTRGVDMLQRFWSAKSANGLAEMAGTGDWRPLVQDVERYRRELRNHSAERFPANVFSLGRRASHAMERILQPTGGWVALIGPDGCGKSFVIEAVTDEFAPGFQKIVRFHLRPKSLPARTNSDTPVTDPHGKPVRGGLYSMAKMLYLFADYWLGYLNSVRTATVRTRLVVFDRYFYDILVDPKRVLYGGPAWLPKILARLVPRPDLVLLLNASPEVLWSRKQEVPYEEVVRQQREYLTMVREMPDAVVIDAARSRPEVVRQVREAILDYFSKRTRRRLKLTNRTRVGAKSASNQGE